MRQIGTKSAFILTRRKTMMNKKALEDEFYDLFTTQVFELAAAGQPQSKIPELAVNKASDMMMQKHGISLPEMLRIVENSIKNHG